jgi:hypothetical protein
VTMTMTVIVVMLMIIQIMMPRQNEMLMPLGNPMLRLKHEGEGK